MDLQIRDRLASLTAVDQSETNNLADHSSADRRVSDRSSADHKVSDRRTSGRAALGLGVLDLAISVPAASDDLVAQHSDLNRTADRNRTTDRIPVNVVPRISVAQMATVGQTATASHRVRRHQTMPESGRNRPG